MRSEWTSPKSAVAMLTGPTARRGGLAVTGQAVLSLTSFLISYLLARTCSPEAFGCYVLALSVMLSASGLQGALITSPLTVFGAAREGDDWRLHVSSMAVAQLVLAMVSVAACALTAWVLAVAADSQPLLWRNFAAMSGAVFFVQMREFARRAMFTRLRAAAVLVNDLLYAGIMVSGVLALLLLGRAGGAAADPRGRYFSGVSVFLVMGAAALLAAAVGAWQVRKDLIFRLEGMGAYLRESWGYAKWAAGNFLGGIFTAQAGTWMIGIVGGVGAAGMVQAARLLIAPLQILSMGAGSVLGPRAARAFGRGGTVELRRFLGRLAPIWVLAFLAYGALVAVAPEFWLSVLYRGKYAGAGLVVLLWVAVFVVQSGLRRLPSLLLSAMRRPDLGLFISLPAGLLALVLTGVFTRYAGPQWAVAGRLVGAVVSCAAIATCAHLLLRKETLQEEREG